MVERVWLGVDLGTQSVRALAVDDGGAVRAAASRPLAGTRRPAPDSGTRHEQDPRDWITATVDALAAVTHRLEGASVAGLAVDATSGTVVLTDGDGRFLTPGVMYDDDRGRDVAERAQQAGEALWRRLGYRVGASWALPTAMAMLAEHPQGHLRHQSDVVTAHLVGGPVRDAGGERCAHSQIVATTGSGDGALPPPRTTTPFVLSPATGAAGEAARHMASASLRSSSGDRDFPSSASAASVMLVICR